MFRALPHSRPPQRGPHTGAGLAIEEYPGPRSRWCAPMILLISDVFVRGDKNLKGSCFRCSQQLTVGQRIPTQVFRLLYRMARKERPKRCGRSVVEENEHLAANRSFEAASRKIQDACNLLSCQVKPFHDFFYAGACFKILEDDGDGHAGTFEKPRAAYFSGDALYRWAL